MDKEPPSPDAKEPSLLKRLLDFFGLDRTPESAEDLEQEIQELLEEGAEHGLITSHEGRMINSIFEFRDTLTHEIMTPRTEMVCAPHTASVADMIRMITDKGYTRIPIYKGSSDNIVGILHAKDLLQYCADCRQAPTAGEMVKPAQFVLESYKIVDLLRDFQAQKHHMAIVTDEFGSVRGLVTLEDVLEEIVGEISDEHDKTETRWKAIDANTLLVDAKLDIEDVEDFFEVELPEGPYESVGGFIIHQLGRLPEAGATVEFPPLLFQVIAATSRRVAIVKIRRQSG